VFLDRDGTLNREDPHGGFVCRSEALELLPGARAGVRALADAGFRIVVLTNQSGIARGLYGQADLARIHARLHACLEERPFAYLHCPHHPDRIGHPYGRPCACRKPGSGLLDQAAALYPIDWAASWLVGDAARDLLIGRDRPLRRVLVRTGKPWREQLAILTAAGCPPDAVADDLPGAAAIVAGDRARRSTQPRST
jgi:D-glycero-D-manno-heptose 1,7-bisphosphate phosphatase